MWINEKCLHKSSPLEADAAHEKVWEEGAGVTVVIPVIIRQLD